MCYKHHEETMTQHDAQRTCGSEGATLIEPRTKADVKLLESEWGQLGKM